MMRKIFILLILSLFIVPSVKALEPDLTIDFSEFCPYPAMQKLDTSKQYILETKKYWAKRKEEFEAHKAACLRKDTYEEQAACISNMRELETEITRDYAAQKEQERNTPYSNTLNFQF